MITNPYFDIIMSSVYSIHIIILLQTNTCGITDKRLTFTEDSEVPTQYVLTRPFSFGHIKQVENIGYSCLLVNDQGDNFDSMFHR